MTGNLKRTGSTVENGVERRRGPSPSVQEVLVDSCKAQSGHREVVGYCTLPIALGLMSPVEVA